MDEINRLHAKYDGPIPKVELDGTLYPSIDDKKQRARSMVDVAMRAIKSRCHNLFSEDVSIHVPHIMYHAQEALRWDRYIKDLEND